MRLVSLDSEKNVLPSPASSQCSMIDANAGVNDKLLDLSIALCGASIDSPEPFPPENSAQIIYNRLPLRAAAPSSAAYEPTTRVSVELSSDDNGHLTVLVPKQVLEARAIAEGRNPRSKRRKVTAAQQPRAPMATFNIDSSDGCLCSLLQKAGNSIPFSSVLGPFLEQDKVGRISLVYGVALKADQAAPARSRLNLALRLLARALDDPTLATPQDFQAGSVDLLQMITRQPSHNPAQVQPPGLKTQLLPYQRDSVVWSLRREGKVMSGVSSVADMDPHIRDYVVAPPLGWRQLPGSEIWVNPYELRTRSREPVPSQPVQFGGKGLLAEEMGLGKTLEMTSLMLLNYRAVGKNEYVVDPITGEQVLKIKATLVVAPKSILTQWKHEITLHAPHMNVLMYKGHESPLEIEQLAEADVVLTSYAQLSLEVHNAVFNPNKRETRNNLFKRPDVIKANRSKLVQVQFWRVIIDEAQMIHTGVSSAAIVARLVPRVHAWAVTGTPVKRSLEDLRGLLYFLDMQPFVAKQCWQRLIASPIDLGRTMSLIGMRHTKPLVSHQLFIPPQRRKLVLLKFSEVERLRYDRLVQRFEEEESTASMTNLNNWLMRLRQACSHATSGSTSSSDVLLTIDQVLGQLVDEADAAVYAKNREMIVLELEKGQLLDRADKLPEAIKTWSRIISVIAQQLENTDERLCQLVEQANAKQAEADDVEKRFAVDNEAQSSKEPSPADLKKENEVLDAKHAATAAQNQVKSVRARRKAYQELLHRTLFFMGTGYFRLSQRLIIKLNQQEIKAEEYDEETQTQLKSNSEQEVYYYDRAEKLRSDILGEAADRVEQSREKIKVPPLSRVAKICHIPKAEIADNLGDLAKEMTTQLLEILSQPLMEDRAQEVKPGEQAENDAYAKTLDLQEYAFDLLNALQLILRDRAAAINGGAVSNPGPQSNESLLKFFERREEIVQLLHHDRTPLSTLMKSVGVDNDAIDKLKAEVPRSQRLYGALRDLYNSRVEYYKQLQELSDQVQDAEFSVGADLAQLIFEKEKAVARTMRSIDALLSRQRYVRNLEGANHKQSQRRTDSVSSEVCPICQDDYTVGSLAPCGHTFCFDCLHKWLSVQSSCPLCKRHTPVSQVVDFKIGDELKEVKSNDEPANNAQEIASELFTPISDSYYNQVLHEPIERMYGIKIDMIVRHMKHLRFEDPTAQVLVFSQWQSMLRVLRSALNENGISAATMGDTKLRVDDFRQDPNIACLLLHAKADVAGLTLINASHVYLCEPFLNTALELQAVSRVNRIGQTRETTVWQFCVENTVEQTILGMTTKQRLLDTAAVGMESADSLTLAEAQSQGNLVDKKSGAEIVGDSVIREILLKKKSK